MEQSVEIRVRRITLNKYDLVIMRDDDVRVMHDITMVGVQDFLRAFNGSMLNSLCLGGSVNVKLNIKFW